MTVQNGIIFIVMKSQMQMEIKMTKIYKAGFWQTYFPFLIEIYAIIYYIS